MEVWASSSLLVQIGAMLGTRVGEGEVMENPLGLALYPAPSGDTVSGEMLLFRASRAGPGAPLTPRTAVPALAPLPPKI